MTHTLFHLIDVEVRISQAAFSKPNVHFPHLAASVLGPTSISPHVFPTARHPTLAWHLLVLKVKTLALGTTRMHISLDQNISHQVDKSRYFLRSIPIIAYADIGHSRGNKAFLNLTKAREFSDQRLPRTK
jgi:hypothetical protein